MVEANAQESQQKEVGPYHQGVLLQVKAAQTSNGLRHNDYGRYHKYCCRRMLRLRKSLQYTQSQKQSKKHVFVEKPVTADLVAQSPKYLQILLFKCESDWAYAMQMKQHASALSGGKAVAQSGTMSTRSNPNRLRIHYLKRFQKASVQASQLLEKATGAVDELSLIEIEGYKAQMNAVYNMERHDYEEALNDFLKAKLIFSEIGSKQDTLETIIFNEKVSQLETFIRSCAASLSLGGDVKLADAAALTSRINSASKQGSAAGSSDVDMKDSGSTLDEVKINGRVIPLKSSKLREAFAALTALEKEIEQLKKSGESEKLVQSQLKLVQTLDEMQLLITKEKKEEA
eukprot:CAMPEP_0170462250 /NCGR_PEP_ID=MMETSP0123-20130129/7825_1 /TAXON_ID=182087 /ORGANISM="Favella ehrenbergii, Strain Fehren 1" /LENGTH=343 /DNA_ID=CAMNT_0010727421 /DNA_START=18 /DNA_END=1049 /DNA_ORIENTATION=-